MPTICVAGKNQVAIDALESVRRRVQDSSIVCLPIPNDCGQDGWQPSFRNYCRQKDMNIVSEAALYEVEDLVFLSVEYSELLNTSSFLSKKLVNLHFSYLPRYRGMYTAAWPILNDETYSGVTIHLIDDGIDTGPIIDQMTFPIDPTDTARDLYYKYLFYGATIFERSIDKILCWNFSASSQRHQDASYFSKKSINFQRCEVDFWQTARHVQNFVRAFYFPEYQVPSLMGRRVNSVHILDCRSYKRPGTILDMGLDDAVVSTIDLDVRVSLARMNPAA